MTDSVRVARSILVFENRRYWTPELQRQFVCENVSVHLCDSSAVVFERLAKADRAVLLFSLVSRSDQPRVKDSLNLQRRIFGQSEKVSTLVLADEQNADLECAFRELGAKAFVVSRISGRELANLCRRQWEFSEQVADISQEPG